MGAKYQQLADRLIAAARTGQRVVEFTFDEVAGLVGGLPPSAHERRQWWANSSSVQAQAWREADWHVDHVNFIQQQVRLLRGKVGGSYLARGRRPASETASAVLVNESDLAELDVRVHMTWQHAWSRLARRGRRLGVPRASAVTRDLPAHLARPGH